MLLSIVKGKTICNYLSAIPFSSNNYEEMSQVIYSPK